MPVVLCLFYIYGKEGDDKIGILTADIFWEGENAREKKDSERVKFAGRFMSLLHLWKRKRC